MRSRWRLLLLGSVCVLLAAVESGCGALRREPVPLPVEIPPPSPPPQESATPTPDEHTVQQVGKASWYGPAHQGKETASGEPFDAQDLTAAHPTLPLGTQATVTNLETGKSVTVTVTDRGPYVKGRKIDLSRAAAKRIGLTKEGVAPVKIVAKVQRKPKKRKRSATTAHKQSRVVKQEAAVSQPSPSHETSPSGEK